MAEFKYEDITEKKIAAAFRVHSTLGNGFPEVIYQRALALEFDTIPIEYKREFSMGVYYLGQHIGTRRVDFLIADKISVELKAAIKVENAHFAQAMNYLEAYNLEIGLLLNFGSSRLEYHRFTNKKYKPETMNYPNNPIHPKNPS
jgi:GxxExxY protein